jgi:intracellular sulfur oxidation DsrE/DsrF family protein
LTRWWRIATLALACGLPAVPAVAQSTDLPAPFASPEPSISHPRKIVLSLSERDPDRVNEVIGNVGNIQRFYGADDVRIVLVAYGPGIHAVLKNESTVRARIAGLLAIGIDILACNATLETLHKTKDDLLPGVVVTPNGIPAIVELEVAGWTYVRP